VGKNGNFIIKSTFWAPKTKWVPLPFAEMGTLFDRYDAEGLRNGDVGVHIQPYVYYYSTPLYMTAFDVEHPDEHHASIQANIDTARNLLYVFEKLGIDNELTISLTGNGFRFTLPYLVPCTHTDAFIAMVRDRKQFPGIDSGPQDGANKFLRTFAYRGNTKQCKTAKDIHIHYLDNPRDILNLDEEAYKKRVQGKPDMSHYCAVLLNIIPQKFASGPLMDILEGYALFLTLKSTIALPARACTNKNYQVNWDQIYTYLDNRGITYHDHEWSAGKIIKLDICPSCQESEGSPYITFPYGKLKCYRSNQCDAGQEGGLKPSEWVEGYQSVVIEAPAEDVKVPTLTLEEAREKNRNAIRNALATGEDIFINTSPGVGKTHEALEQAVPEAQHKRVLYTAPTLQLAKEAFEKAQGIAEREHLDIAILSLTGRNKDICKNMSEVNLVAEMGYIPSYIACSHCGHNKGCLYHKQFEEIPKTGFICTSHDTAMAHENRIKPDLWLIDENPLDKFFLYTEATQSEMNQMKDLEADEIKPLFEAVEKVAETIANQIDGYDQARIYVNEAPPGKWEESPLLKDITPGIRNYFDNNLLPINLSLPYQRDPDKECKWQNVLYKKNLCLHAVKFWDHIIIGDDNVLAYIKITKGREGKEILYVTIRYRPPRFENCQIIHLDGTMYKPEIDVIFPKCDEIVDAQVKLDHCPKIFVRSARGKTKMKQLDFEKKEEDIGFLLEFLRESDRKVLLITHQMVEDEVLGIAKFLCPERTFGKFHFWGPRGTNEFEDFDACIVYGTPTINPNAVEDTAMTLYDNLDDMARWKDNLGQRDLTQAIHRIRPVNRSKSIIVMGSYWPLEYLGQPAQQIDRMRKGDNYSEAKERLRIFAEQHGFIDKSIAMLLGVATRNDQKALDEIQKKISGEWGGTSELALTLYYIYKSQDQLLGTPPAIFLGGSSDWKRMMDDLHAETNLPYIWFCPKGPGRKSLALGTIDAVAAFCKNTGTVFSPEQYELYLIN